MISEVLKLQKEIQEEEVNLGILIVSSPDKIYTDWEKSKNKDREISHIEKILKKADENSTLITIIDGHSSALAWLGSVRGHKVYPLGVREFGQSGDLNEIYEYSNIDFKSIIDRIAKSILNY